MYVSGILFREKERETDMNEPPEIVDLRGACASWKARAESAEAKLAQEHENFLTVHRENLGLVNRNAELTAKLAAPAPLAPEKP